MSLWSIWSIRFYFIKTWLPIEHTPKITTCAHLRRSKYHTHPHFEWTLLSHNKCIYRENRREKNRKAYPKKRTWIESASFSDHYFGAIITSNALFDGTKQTISVTEFFSSILFSAVISWILNIFEMASKYKYPFNLWYAHISRLNVHVYTIESISVMNDRHMDHSIPAHWMASQTTKQRK